MSALSPAAIAELDAAGITPAQWIAYGGWRERVSEPDGSTRWVPAAEWHGDVCGCKDDRCVGYHHDENEECGCLPVLIEERERGREAHALWAAYRAAVEANDQVAYDAALARAEAWVRRYRPGALTFALDVVVNGEQGLSVTYPGKDPGYAASMPEGDGWRMLEWSDNTDEDGFIREPTPNRKAQG